MKGHVHWCNQNRNAPGENSKIVAIAGPQKKGKVVEYGVRMKRIVHEYRMDMLLSDRRVCATNIRKIASALSRFHSTAVTNRTIQSYG
jgi:aminoglycoside phosphotransferase family enzyme